MRADGLVTGTAKRLGLVLAFGALLTVAEAMRREETAAALEPEPERPEPRRAHLELAPPPEPRPLRRRLRLPRWARTALLLAVLAAWAWFLLPQSLGGSASWVLVSGESMLPRYHTGDLVLVRRQSAYRVGDVIAYRVPKGDPMAGAQVIHRIVGGNAWKGFVVQGDNRTAPDVWHPTAKDVVGAKVLQIPKAYLVLQFLRSPLLLGLLAAAFVFAHTIAGGRPQTPPEPKAGEDEAAEEERAA